MIMDEIEKLQQMTTDIWAKSAKEYKEETIDKKPISQ